MICSRMGMNMQKMIRAGDIRKAGRHPWKNSMPVMANKAMAVLWGSSVGDVAKRDGMQIAINRIAHATMRSFADDVKASSSPFMKRISP